MAKREEKRSTNGDPQHTTRGDGQPAASSAHTNDWKIRERAYELYVERGDGPGDELDDWLRAERELGRM